MTTDETAPSDAEVLKLGSWPAYAQVLARAERIIAVLIDTNGDGRLVEFEGWNRDPDGAWRLACSCGAGRWGSGEIVGRRVDYGHEGGEWWIRLGPS